MAWYEFHHMANHFHGITPALPPEELPFLFPLEDFEPAAISNWQPRPVIISNDKRRRRGDFPCFTSMPPVLNARALDALRPLLSGCDVLPLLCDEEPLVAINPPILATALLLPEAMPALRSSAAARTVAVTGATTSASPSPIPPWSRVSESATW